MFTKVEPPTRIELVFADYKATVLPLNYRGSIVVGDRSKTPTKIFYFKSYFLSRKFA